MKKEHFIVNGMDTQLVEFSHGGNNLLYARFGRIQLEKTEMLQKLDQNYLN